MREPNGSLTVIYRGAVLVLFAVLCFLGANMYHTLSSMPKEYITVERYCRDMDRMERAISDGFKDLKLLIEAKK